MLPDIVLKPVSREDVQRLAQWLNDPAVSSFWYGGGEDGRPLHIGYSPHNLLQASEEEWKQVFEDEDRKIFSVYTPNNEHIGEGQLAVNWPLLEAQAHVVIGRKDMWHQQFGSAAMLKLLDSAFGSYGLHRVWVDIPDYNERALDMCRHLGFVLEGRRRRTHRKDGNWYDSIAMGLLVDEYLRRRPSHTDTPAKRTASPGINGKP